MTIKLITVAAIALPLLAACGATATTPAAAPAQAAPAVVAPAAAPAVVVPAAPAPATAPVPAPTHRSVVVKKTAPAPKPAAPKPVTPAPKAPVAEPTDQPCTQMGWHLPAGAAWDGKGTPPSGTFWCNGDGSRSAGPGGANSPPIGE